MGIMHLVNISEHALYPISKWWNDKSY